MWRIRINDLIIFRAFITPNLLAEPNAQRPTLKPPTMVDEIGRISPTTGSYTFPPAAATRRDPTPTCQHSLHCRCHRCLRFCQFCSAINNTAEHEHLQFVHFGRPFSTNSASAWLPSIPWPLYGERRDTSCGVRCSSSSLRETGRGQKRDDGWWFQRNHDTIGYVEWMLRNTTATAIRWHNNQSLIRVRGMLCWSGDWGVKWSR